MRDRSARALRRRLGVLTAGFLVASAVIAVPAGANADAASDPASVPALTGGALHPLAPARILDTRDGTGGHRGALGQGRSIDVQITGRGGVPTDGVGSVLLNVTATNGSTATYVTVFPTGATRPTASNLNPKAGQSVPNLVEVAVGAGGEVSVYNNSGTVDVIFDVAGWVAAAPEDGTAGLFTPLAPSRLLDTRDGTGRPGPGALGPNATIALQVTGRAGIPATGVSAVVLNVTITEPTAPTFITAWPSDVWRPLASNLNAVPGQTVPNRVTVKVGADGRVNLYNLAGSAHLIADVGGYYSDGTDATASGARFTGVTPVRLLDSRSTAAIGPGATRRVQVAGRAGLPGPIDRVPPTAAVVNVTVTEPTIPGYVTAFPAQHTKPLASDLNFTAGLTVPNLVVVQLGPDGAIDFFNLTGSTHVIVDLLGYYTGDVVLAPGVRPLDPTTAGAITSVTDTTVTFDGVPTAFAGLAVGDIITVGITALTPDGLLRIVDAINTPGGNLTLTTHQAALDQVLTQGSLRADASTTGAALPSPASLSAGFSAGPSFERTITIDLGDMTAVGTIAGQATLSVDVSIGLFPPHFDSEITGEVSGSGEASFNSETERSVSECQDLPSIRLTAVTYMIGPVPIVISPSVQPKFCVEGEAKVGIASHGSASFSAGVTAKTHNGSVSVTPFADHSLDLGIDGRPAEVSLNFTLGAKVEAELALSIDGVHVLEIGPSAGIEMAFNGCRITLTAKLGLSGTLQVKFLEFESPAYPIDIPLTSKDFDPIDVVKCAYWTGSYQIIESTSGSGDGWSNTLFWQTTFTVGAPPEIGKKAPGTRVDNMHQLGTYVIGDCAHTTSDTGYDSSAAEFDSSVVTRAADGQPALELDIVDDGYIPITRDETDTCFPSTTSTYSYLRGDGGPFVLFPLEKEDSVTAVGSRIEPVGAPGDQTTGTRTFTWGFTKHCFFGLEPTEC